MLKYSLDFVRRTGGVYLTLLELQSREDLDVAEVCFAIGTPLCQVCSRLVIRLGRELDMNRDSSRFTPAAKILASGETPLSPATAQLLIDRHYVVLLEGKNFWQYAEPPEQYPRYLVHLSRLADRQYLIEPARFFRLAYRQIQNAANVRTIIMTLVAPGAVSGHSVRIEVEPWSRPTHAPLRLMATANSFSFDFLMRVRSTANVTKFLMDASPTPLATACAGTAPDPFALRLTCNHSGYQPLWREQLDEAWREDGKSPMTWPVLAGDDERWAVRAAIDAVVADAYGLSRDQYAHVLSTFSHASYPKAPELCLARFDELKQIGLEKFTRKYDPYWDIPLNENLPKPVIDLPIPGEAKEDDGGEYRLTGAVRPTKRRARKK